MSSTATFDPLVPPTPKPASGALQIAAATVGNALEWFDILIYGYFATSIAGAFFPNSNPVVSLTAHFWLVWFVLRSSTGRSSGSRRLRGPVGP